MTALYIRKLRERDEGDDRLDKDFRIKQKYEYPFRKTRYFGQYREHDILVFVQVDYI